MDINAFVFTRSYYMFRTPLCVIIFWKFMDDTRLLFPVKKKM